MEEQSKYKVKDIILLGKYTTNAGSLTVIVG